ncbi:hypothetical protein G6F57_005371 [Rhizopus arrhizus]|uniref:Kinesin-like protein n=1 Tax=Rhizopus oryzae TaxID=64495 RepID=A0A9P6X1R7_RHIOR|nr:hypothetical protein G6F30_011655 [Rhizopus arrhizus]KAG1406113.1 hypothetical protein G6F58_009887 [Rhizopus delemar]KAG0975113.1 hypothetical protein G6F29_011760 [Rhizopus arrhizus]KAG0995307.1 hypothetical protein G6F28_004915 [Rhizopus arrhizus]KAG1002823.1 hypothetical protein G6F27_011608 [Rhizopus arrhizus]
MSTCTVRVALRVRPFLDKEEPKSYLSFIPNQPHIIIDQNRQFTFDHVYSPSVSQEDVYQSAIQPLFDQFITGYNATILAYGQTGSGKTYSMGTSYHQQDPKQYGIVPRFAENLFDWIQTQLNNNDMTYKVRVSFLELYNEEIIDLLNINNSSITIREDVIGNISWSGVYEQEVKQSKDLLNCLYQGSIARTTASTDMNSQSSRSHAIFSVTLTQHVSSAKKEITSKFHFVDLAGSERLKKTNAVGDRAREGISINAGLLALGNVISALSDDKLRGQYIPYRNSKLTRLLQDSLGGNSQTLMLACVSPADSNQHETLSTIKYANRAKRITNKVMIHQEQNETEALKEQVRHLRQELELSDAFIKEVHLELDELRKRNETLEAALGRAKLEDDELTLVGSSSDENNHRLSVPIPTRTSSSTKRKKKSYHASSTHRKRWTAASSDRLEFIERQKDRIQQDALLLKQFKASKEVDVSQLISLCQSSIKEQKQLIHSIEQLPPAEPKNKRSSLPQPKQPKRIPSETSHRQLQVEMDRLILENENISAQVKQMGLIVKRVFSMMNNATISIQQLKPILNKAVVIHNTLIKQKTNDVSKRSSLDQTRSAEAIYQDIQKLVSLEHVKNHATCAEITQELKQKKIQLMREQKELLKERKEMITEFYNDDASQQDGQQYMDERIDEITIQVDYLSLQIQELTAFSKPSTRPSLADLIQPLKENELRSLLFLVIQQDVIRGVVKSSMYRLAEETLYRYQQGLVQLRRLNKVMNNQILQNLLQSPTRILTNGLVLISGKK